MDSIAQTPTSTACTIDNTDDNVEDVHSHFPTVSVEDSIELSDYFANTDTPYKRTIDMYKERCSELETELVHQHAAAVAKNLEIETLKTKVSLITEYYQSLNLESKNRHDINESFSTACQGKEEKDFTNIQSGRDVPILAAASPPPPSPSVLKLALKCAELEAELNAKQPKESKIVLHSIHTVKNSSESRDTQQKGATLAGPELLALLRSACRQLEEARRVGSQLRVKLARNKQGIHIKM